MMHLEYLNQHISTQLWQWSVFIIKNPTTSIFYYVGPKYFYCSKMFDITLILDFPQGERTEGSILLHLHV